MAPIEPAIPLTNTANDSAASSVLFVIVSGSLSPHAASHAVRQNSNAPNVDNTFDTVVGASMLFVFKNIDKTNRISTSSNPNPNKHVAALKFDITISEFRQTR